MTIREGVIIDAHHHLWDPRSRRYPWLSDVPSLDRAFQSSDLSAAIAELPVKGTVVVQATSTDEETRWLLDAAQSSDLILGVVGWVDLLRPGVSERLMQLSNLPLVGIRHQAQDEPDPAWLVRAEVIQGLGAVRDAGLPFDLLVRRQQRPAALRLVASMPDQYFVIDHLAKPEIAAGEWSSWYAWMVAMASHPAVFCKISGLVTEADWRSWRTQHLKRYINAALELFGPDRCMFGSDWPVSLLAAEYGEVVNLVEAAIPGLTAAERDSLWRGTATSVYGLSSDAGTS